MSKWLFIGVFLMFIKGYSQSSRYVVGYSNEGYEALFTFFDGGGHRCTNDFVVNNSSEFDVGFNFTVYVNGDVGYSDYVYLTGGENKTFYDYLVCITYDDEIYIEIE